MSFSRKVRTIAKNPKDYCKKSEDIQPPSFHGKRKYRRKTRVEKIKEEREEERDKFVQFLKKDERRDLQRGGGGGGGGVDKSE
jgi:hypothetical protein